MNERCTKEEPGQRRGAPSSRIPLPTPPTSSLPHTLTRPALSRPTPHTTAAAARADSVAVTPSPDTALTLPGGDPLTFENAALLGENTRVLWTKAADGSVTGAFDVASPGWAAFGFPGPKGSMLGGNVVIASPDPAARSLASARTATLAGYSPDAFVSPAEGLKVAPASLAAGIPATGRIAATFKLETVPAGGKVMIASGPMASSGPLAGKMGIHPPGKAAVAELAF
jgi:hypothetical protein